MKSRFFLLKLKILKEELLSFFNQIDTQRKIVWHFFYTITALCLWAGVHTMWRGKRLLGKACYTAIEPHVDITLDGVTKGVFILLTSCQCQKYKRSRKRLSVASRCKRVAQAFTHSCCCQKCRLFFLAKMFEEGEDKIYGFFMGTDLIKIEGTVEQF